MDFKGVIKRYSLLNPERKMGRIGLTKTLLLKKSGNVTINQ